MKLAIRDGYAIFSLRIGRRTGEKLLTLISTTRDLPGLQEQAESWLEVYPQLMGIALNHNPEKTNAIFGQETRTVAGQAYIREMFAGVDIYLRPDTFFQVNTEMAEVLLKTISQQLNLQGTELLLDAYCGVGTFTLPLARQVKEAIGIEVYPASLAQAEFNAKQNGINKHHLDSGKSRNRTCSIRDST